MKAIRFHDFRHVSGPHSRNLFLCPQTGSQILTLSPLRKKIKPSRGVQLLRTAHVCEVDATFCPLGCLRQTLLGPHEAFAFFSPR